jgi:hypothetical protein
MVPAMAFQFNRETNDGMAVTLLQLGPGIQAGVPSSSFGAKLPVPHIQRFPGLPDFEQIDGLDQIAELGIAVIA